MDVNVKIAESKNLIIKDKKGKHYFCSKNCKNEFINGIKWYRSKKFGNLFPYFLAIILIGGFIWSLLGEFMIKYMGGFFVIFSLFKMPDWKGFVDAFSKYDFVAKRFDFYGWIYPALEFLLGLGFLFGIWLNVVAIITLIITGIGGMGIGWKLIKKEKFQCACLGTKINVPLTKVTLLENLLMFVMSLILLL